jgi:hypothetical protein
MPVDTASRLQVRDDFRLDATVLAFAKLAVLL